MSENINIRNFLIKIFEQKANEALVEQLYAHDPGTLPQDLNANNIVGYLVRRLGFNPTSNRKKQK